MALHKDLPIYKTAFDLFKKAIEITQHFPRDFKRLMADKIREESIEIMLLIFRANVAEIKQPHINDLLERLQVIELTLRVSQELRFISLKQYAAIVELTDSVGKQASGWRKQQATSPVSEPPRQLPLCD